VIFALLHVYQAASVPEILGILAITGTGSVLLCWVFTKWYDNLWAAFFVHALMNLWWEVFAVDDTALGGWHANAARLATVLLGVVLSLYKDRLWPRLPVEDENLDHVEAPAPGLEGQPVRRYILRRPYLEFQVENMLRQACCSLPRTPRNLPCTRSIA